VQSPANGWDTGGDQTDLAGAVAVAVAVGDLAAVVGFDRFQRIDSLKTLQDLGRRHDLVQMPTVGRPDIHVFDETQDDSAVPKVLGHRQEAMVVEAALDDH
jgi:hypothetical protein